ncbi:MAG: HAD-IB family hydrolase [Parachlamydiaceae bacterium]|nr:HAD-IB family hydrolase [Parachlamydiaceae bacterium]
MNFQQHVAAFDFDGTITYCDTLLPFLLFNAGIWRTTYHLTALTPQFVSYLRTHISRQDVKEHILTQFLAGRPRNDLLEQGEKYSQRWLPKLIRPSALQRLRWHQRQGHRCVLISANIDLYLNPWAQEMGFNDVICSVCATDDQDRLSGKLVGENCWGPVKAKRLLNLIGPKENVVLYAYGDSAGDRDLLHLADYAFYRGLQ